MEFYCGIDLHAKTSTLVVIDERGEKVGQTTIKNDMAKILAFLGRFEGEVSCVVESTYNWYWLVDGLAEGGYDIKLAHAYGLHLISGSKFKSDKKDAERLARLLRLGEIPESYIYPKGTRPLRDLMRTRIRLVRERGQLRAAAKNSLARYNLKMDFSALEGSFAAEAVRLLPIPDEVKMELATAGERMALLTSQIERLERWLVKVTVSDPRFRELMRIPGVGYVLALTIYYETGDASRFHSGRHYSSYCRLVPSSSISAEKEKRGKGGKQGNPYLKWAFCQAAMGAARHDEGLRAFRDRHARRRGGKSNLLANCILAHKLALAAYSILACGQEFRPEMIGGEGKRRNDQEARRGDVGHLTGAPDQND